MAGLVIDKKLPLSHSPAGTVTCNGMPNVVWAVNEMEGLVMLFMAQLLPVDDERAVD
ncbi:hypothetical protein BT63DRAFT_425310 [Microthyrium microscopicum]|uniref:Uncharacterized protein n=1 Tax=Microthyrium microscopicum TaxID=703497 RepID=A0A6A6UDZ9_9PEZI|nr:hypothetical protein BT63DRAFT_425310 [Microthyrium microscopicum]